MEVLIRDMFQNLRKIQSANKLEKKSSGFRGRTLGC